MTQEYGMSVTSSLEQSMKTVQSALNKLNTITGQPKIKSGNRYLPRQKAAKASKASLTTLEKLAEPLLKSVASSTSGSGDDSGQAINIAMTIIGAESNNFGMSQGQVAAQTASAISRAMQRNL